MLVLLLLVVVVESRRSDGLPLVHHFNLPSGPASFWWKPELKQRSGAHTRRCPLLLPTNNRSNGMRAPESAAVDGVSCCLRGQVTMAGSGATVSLRCNER